MKRNEERIEAYCNFLHELSELSDKYKVYIGNDDNGLYIHSGKDSSNRIMLCDKIFYDEKYERYRFKGGK